MKLDAKFYGEIRKVKDDSIVPEDQYMVFLAKDNAFAAVLPVYLAICKSLGADDENIGSIERTMARLTYWRSNNPDKCKIPDAKGERLLA